MWNNIPNAFGWCYLCFIKLSFLQSKKMPFLLTWNGFLGTSHLRMWHWSKYLQGWQDFELACSLEYNGCPLLSRFGMIHFLVPSATGRFHVNPDTADNQRGTVWFPSLDCGASSCFWVNLSVGCQLGMFDNDWPRQSRRQQGFRYLWHEWLVYGCCS